ncbi:MAG: hypothetical protein SPG51_11040 [Bariatricus sp.]|nr:hypothetical protein [Bariatricus sp.]
MLPVNCGSHSDYQNFVLENLRKYYPNPDSIARSTWDIIDRFWNLDLSYTDEKLKNRYSVFGPKPRTPSCMHRSYLLSLDFKVTSLTEWAAQLKINPLYATLSGFEFGDTPGVGTFYDFLNRLWDSDEDNLSPHIHPIKVAVKKPSAKGAKAKPVEKSLLSNSYRNWKTLPSPFLNSLMVLCLTFIIGNSYSSLFLNSLLILMPWLLPVMVLLLLLLQENESIVFVIVPLKVSMTVPVTVTFPSLIATSDGIHPVPVFIMDTIYICWLLLIRKATFLFSLC